MITTYAVVQVEDKFTCINTNNNYAEIVGGVYTTPTQAFYYALKELDQTNNGPFVVEYLKKIEEKDDNGSQEN